MEYTEVVRRRRMVRSFDPDRPVDRATVDRLLDLAVRAPSAGFTQGWAFLVLDTPETRDRFWLATSDASGKPDAWLRGMRTAHVLVVALSDKDAYIDRYAEPDKGWIDRDVSRWLAPYWHIDTGMASLLILLGAVDSGLGACFFGIPTDRLGSVREQFTIPDRLSPIGVIALGYPGRTRRRSPSLQRGRRPREQTVFYGSFQAPSSD